MRRQRLTIVQAAVGGLLLANGIDGHGWDEIVIGAAAIVLAFADGGRGGREREPGPLPPARSGQSVCFDTSDLDDLGHTRSAQCDSVTG